MFTFNKILIFTFIYCLASIILAYTIDDSHLSNRMGATLSALGAILVIWQIRREIILFDQDLEDDKSASADSLSPSNQRIAEKVKQDRSSRRLHERLNNLYVVAVVIFFGELMHGWGDYPVYIVKDIILCFTKV